MAGETVITLVGNLTADPELRFTPSGSAVSNFTIASTPRTFDKNTNSWVDGEPLFIRCSVWREAAENVANTLQKGMRVIAQGRLSMRNYDTKEGQKRTVTEMEVDEIGPSLRFATAVVTRAQGGNGGGQQGGGYNQQHQQQNQGYNQQQPPQQQQQQQRQNGPQQNQQQGGGWNAPANDPWQQGGQQGGGWGNPGNDEPPF